jgi:arabinan endo-1,5-alpha-L-arabinosidase
MLWGSFWDGIQIAPLEADGSTLRLAGAPRTLARRHVPGSKFAEPNPTSQFAGRNAIEAPFIMKKGRYYYLFVSWDYCCRGSKSNYRVAVGRSQSVDGPYLDKDGLNMLYGGGFLLAEGDKKTYEAMGHCSAYTMNGEDLFLCHGYSIEKGGASLLVQKKIRWQDDWPLLEP